MKRGASWRLGMGVMDFFALGGGSPAGRGSARRHIRKDYGQTQLGVLEYAQPERFECKPFRVWARDRVIAVIREADGNDRPEAVPASAAARRLAAADVGARRRNQPGRGGRRRPSETARRDLWLGWPARPAPRA